MSTINKPFRKKDAMQLVTGQPVYMDDVIPQDCLIVKLLRSPHANAIVKTINTAVAKKVPGIEAIFTWEDVPQDAPRYTQAGQTYPEASPRDRLLIDRHVRFVGDVVAIVAGKDEKCVDKALKLIKVEYEVLEAVLDYHTAKDNPILVHPEDNWASLCPVGADNKRNLCAHDESGSGDIDAVLAASDVVIDHVYHTKACQQAMMETFRTYCSIDTYGRLNVLSSTQIVFHARRNIANALHIPKSMVRVAKPRIGGGFGAKQTAVSEVYPAFVTWKTKKPSKIIFSRVESQIASSPRHEMEIHVRLGATKDGVVKGIDPEQHVLFVQSHVPAHCELSWVLACNTQFGELSRMTQFKDKSAKHPDNVNGGLFTYPVLMAADILVYNADLVPVGQDQTQHLEIARTIANRFNGIYGDTFTLPEGYVPAAGAKIMSLAEPTKKMSKSDTNANAFVLMTDDKDTIVRKFKRAVTDSDGVVRFDAENKPGVSNLMSIYSAISGKTFEEIETMYDGQGYGTFKKDVADLVVEELSPIRSRYDELTGTPELDAILDDGAVRARAKARVTYENAIHAMGLYRK